MFFSHNTCLAKNDVHDGYIGIGSTICLQCKDWIKMKNFLSICAFGGLVLSSLNGCAEAKKPGEKKMFTIAKASDVKVILTEAVVKMIKIRPTKNKKSPNQANIRGDQEDEEMDIALLNDPATEDTTTS